MTRSPEPPTGAPVGGTAGARQRRVVAVAAPIGGGKSELVRGLALALGGAATVLFDDYEQATQMSPERLRQWLADGADFGALLAPGFARALEVARRQPAAARPAGEDGRPGFVVVEMPLGRTSAATAALIDFLIWVETPLDIALARNIRKLAGEASAAGGDARPFLLWLEAYLSQYLDPVRAVLELQRERVAAYADLVLDGRRAPHELVAEAAKAVRDLAFREAGRQGPA